MANKELPGQKRISSATKKLVVFWSDLMHQKFPGAIATLNQREVGQLRNVFVCYKQDLERVQKDVDFYFSRVALFNPGNLGLPSTSIFLYRFKDIDAKANNVVPEMENQYSKFQILSTKDAYSCF